MGTGEFKKLVDEAALNGWDMPRRGVRMGASPVEGTVSERPGSAEMLLVVVGKGGKGAIGGNCGTSAPEEPRHVSEPRNW